MTAKIVDPNAEDGGRDAALIAQLYTEFFQDLGIPPENYSLTNLPASLTNDHSIWTIDPDGPAVCQVEVREDEVQLEVLLPRDGSIRTAARLLGLAFNEALRRFPEAAGRRTWTMLPSGRNSRGKVDGGQRILSYWQRRWPVVRIIKEEGTWKLVATLEQIAGASRPRGVTWA